MALPGNYTIGYLEEDNPQKAYFRFRPLFICEDGKYTPFEDAVAQFPQDGFIRIVPDKNESSHFKARMRRLARYCALDLRKHTGMNDKIRPNKNFSPERAEMNEFIVYSDVICELPANQLCEILAAPFPEEGGEETHLADANPGTRAVFLQSGEALKGPYLVRAGEDDGLWLAPRGAGELSLEACKGRIANLSFVDGTGARVLAPCGLEGFFALDDAPAPSDPQSEAERPAPAEAAGVEAAQEIAPKVEPRAEEPKPWLAPDRQVNTRPRAVNARLGGGGRAFTGLNPRRGASIYEIVDEQWRKSRYDQLGHPVPQDVQAVPLENPLDLAARSVRAAWERPDVRAALMEQLLQLEEFELAFAERAGIRERRSGASDSACELEAARIKLAMEIDELKRNRQQFRAQLYDEIRETRAEELKRMAAAREQARREVCADERLAREARERAERAQKKFQELIEGGLAEKAAEADALCALKRPARLGPPCPGTCEPSAGELISRVRTHFAGHGRALSNEEAVNLLCAFCAERILFLSGPTGSGKSDTARLLAGALGLSERFEELRPGKGSAFECEAFCRLNTGEDMLTPRVALLDDANLSAEDPLRGLETLGEAKLNGAHPALRVVATLQDDGLPVAARVLGRGNFIRLPHAPLDAPPAFRPAKQEDALDAVSLDALERVFAPEAEIPAEIEERLAILRAKLAEIGVFLPYRALTGMWEFLARFLKHVRLEPDAALDLALAQRAIPEVLASAPLIALHMLPEALKGYPRCLALLEQPLPLPPI